MLIKNEKPTEISFYSWINGYPESGHPTDRENFYRFVRTACRYRAQKWLDPTFLKKKILESKPNMRSESAKKFLCLMEHLRDFHKVQPLPDRGTLLGCEAECLEEKYPNCFQRVTVKDGKVVIEMRPMSEWKKHKNPQGGAN